ncbi:MAG: aldehyde dehydrogenase family protein [Actinobacteria bacterium]|nr:aldehyde dehydrogenase family protein [Actinomycetota bacterium]
MEGGSRARLRQRGDPEARDPPRSASQGCSPRPPPRRFPRECCGSRRSRAGPPGACSRTRIAGVTFTGSTTVGLRVVGAVHGRDLGRAVEVASRLECGLQRVNAPTPGVDYYAPFGGELRSGFGPREQGRAAREFFTHSRTITIVEPVPG